MDYQKHYNKLIERARDRQINGYFEKHHVIPKCMGGSNDKNNIVKLTAAEHYLAHLLLINIYPHVKKLISAVFLMTGSTNNGSERHSNKKYAWVRELFIKRCTGVKLSDNHKLNLSLSHKGKPLSEKQIQANKARRGIPVNERSRAALDKYRNDPDVIKKRGVGISNAKKGIKQSEAHKLALSKVRKGKSPSEETRKKISDANIGKPKSDKTKMLMSIARRRTVDLKKEASYANIQ